jgi:shikimate dehydrogenase
MGLPYAEVIGDPIGHSKSPLIHKFWLDKCEIEGRYGAVRVTEPELAAYLEDRRADPDWQGCNVTRPLKEAVFRHSAMPDDFVGAANILSPADDGALISGNTDFLAVHALLAPRDLAGRNAIVVGTGGAARATLAALRGLPTGSVTLMCRSPEKGRRLLEHFGLPGSAEPLGTLVGDAGLLINATPLGMAGYPPADIDLGGMPPDAIVFDMVYDPVQTDLLARARERGMTVIDGLEMLVEQAESSFGTFFNAVPPRDRDPELRELLTQ